MLLLHLVLFYHLSLQRYFLNKKIMKRKALFVLSLVVAMLSLSNVRVSAFPIQVRFQTGYVDPHNEQDEPNRTPVQPPLIYIEDGTLTFVTNCDGCELRLVNAEDEVEYTTVISSSTLVLPSTLTGSYQLQIICGDYIFYGEINL